MTIEILRASSYRVQPWKNGKGTTAEIARFPTDSDCEYQWRFSMADIQQSGPFSQFPGMSRSLVLLEGSPVNLIHSPNIGVKYLNLLEPYQFDGSWDTRAEVKAAGKDFNLIYRTDLLKSYTCIHTLQKEQKLKVSTKDHVVLIFCLSAELQFESTMLRKYDSVLVTNESRELTIMAGEKGATFLECSLKSQ